MHKPENWLWSKPLKQTPIVKALLKLFKNYKTIVLTINPWTRIIQKTRSGIKYIKTAWRFLAFACLVSNCHNLWNTCPITVKYTLCKFPYCNAHDHCNIHKIHSPQHEVTLIIAYLAHVIHTWCTLTYRYNIINNIYQYIVAYSFPESSSSQVTAENGQEW